MANIAPSLLLLWDVKRSLEKGKSVSFGVKNYLMRPVQDNFKSNIEIWWASQTNNLIIFNKSQLNHKRRYLLDLLEAGLRGHSILTALSDLENELILSCELEIQNYVAKLPFLTLIPLMFFVFPAMMILLIAPLLRLMQL